MLFGGLQYIITIIRGKFDLSVAAAIEKPTSFASSLDIRHSKKFLDKYK